MLFWVAVAGAAVMASVAMFVMLRLIGLAVAAPAEWRAGVRGTGDDWASSEIGRLGFEPLGILLFPAAKKDAEPIERTALRAPTSDTAAATGETARGLLGIVFLSAWADGAYVITRCPQPRFFATRRTDNTLAGFGATPTKAWAAHRAAVAEFSVSRGLPLKVETLDDAAACYRAAAPTFKRTMIRTVLVVLPLGLAGWAVLIWANFAR